MDIFVRNVGRINIKMEFKEEYKCPYCNDGIQTVSTNPNHFYCWNCKSWDYPAEIKTSIEINELMGRNQSIKDLEQIELKTWVETTYMIIELKQLLSDTVYDSDKQIKELINKLASRTINSDSH